MTARRGLALLALAGVATGCAKADLTTPTPSVTVTASASASPSVSTSPTSASATPSATPIPAVVPTPRPSGVGSTVAWASTGKWTHLAAAGVVTSAGRTWTVGRADGRSALVRIGGKGGTGDVLPLPVQPADGLAPVLVPTSSGVVVVVQPDSSSVTALTYKIKGTTLALGTTSKTTKESGQKVTWGGADVLIPGTVSHAAQVLVGGSWKTLDSADRWVTVASTDEGKTRAQIRLSPGSSAARFGKKDVQLDAASDTWEAIGTRDGVLLATHGTGRNSCELYSWKGQKMGTADCPKKLGNLVQSTSGKVRSFGAVLMRGNDLTSAPMGGDVTAVTDQAVYLDGATSTEVRWDGTTFGAAQKLGVRVVGFGPRVAVMEDDSSAVVTAPHAG